MAEPTLKHLKQLADRGAPFKPPEGFWEKYDELFRRRILANQRLAAAEAAAYKDVERPGEAMLEDLLIALSDFPVFRNSFVEMRLAQTAARAQVHIATGRLRWEQENAELAWERHRGRAEP